MRQNDQFYVDAFSQFVSRFDCASKRIKARGFKVATTPGEGALISDHSSPNRNGTTKVIGHQYSNSCWTISPTTTLIHPFLFMLEGRYSRTLDLARDVEHMYQFPAGTIRTAFADGFCLESDYKDCWSAKSIHWCLSAAFNVGRYFVNKHLDVSKDYYLPFKLPEILTAANMFERF